MPIKVLAPDVVSRIAAGEVVERPASVVKELVENSLDAGANRITIEVSSGGTQLIKVTDNGSGILADEVEVAFERHATGKITSDADLETISTLGFRGEALPSIASVANVSLVTRHRDEDAGVVLRLERGTVASRARQGAPQGTVLTVRDLFQNVPARLKFLKSAATENSHIGHLVTQYALAFPEVKFELLIGGRSVLRSTGNGVLRDALVDVYGLEMARAMLEISPPATESTALSITGFVSPASVSRANRNYLSLFVNRRWVQGRMLTYAVEEAYKGLLMTGKHPIAVLNISIDPREIDVNVHPTKSEIKFRREGEVFIAVQKAVRNTLIGSSPVAGLKLALVPAPAPPLPATPFSVGYHQASRPVPAPRFVPKREETAPMPIIGLPILRVIGQLRHAYIVAEGPDGLYLIDQHAAHERIVFEKLLEQQVGRTIEVQALLEPLAIEATVQQMELLRSKGEALERYGFSLELFGEKTYLVRAVPAMLKNEVIRAVLAEVLDSIGEMTQQGDWQERIARSLACHGAVRSGKPLSQPEMEELVQQLEKTALPRTCPHGRPTIVHLGMALLEREFGR